MPDTITIEMIYQEAPELRRIVNHAEMLRKSGEGDPRYNVWLDYSALKLEGERHVGWFRTIKGGYGRDPAWMCGEHAFQLFIVALCDALNC